MISLDRVFVSTGAFKDSSLDNIIRICEQNRIGNVELSSNIKYESGLENLIKKYKRNKNLRFLIHNYFPPAKNPFVLNLASNKSSILNLSRKFCLGCIDLCSELRISTYSVHAGFCFNAKPNKLGAKITELDRIPKSEAEKYYIESIQLISEYAKNRDVSIAIENNVVAPFNLIENKNILLLGATSEELLNIRGKVGCDNVYLLLDVGHCKVTANSMCFDANQFIKDLAPYTIAVHLNENNGCEDNNYRISHKSWFWKPINSYLNQKVYFVLEAYNLSVKMIKKQLKIICSSLHFNRERYGKKH